MKNVCIYEKNLTLLRKKHGYDKHKVQKNGSTYRSMKEMRITQVASRSHSVNNTSLAL